MKQENFKSTEEVNKRRLTKILVTIGCLVHIMNVIQNTYDVAKLHVQRNIYINAKFAT